MVTGTVLRFRLFMLNVVNVVNVEFMIIAAEEMTVDAGHCQLMHMLLGGYQLFMDSLEPSC